MYLNAGSFFWYHSLYFPLSGEFLSPKHLEKERIVSNLKAADCLGICKNQVFIINFMLLIENAMDSWRQTMRKNVVTQERCFRRIGGEKPPFTLLQNSLVLVVLSTWITCLLEDKWQLIFSPLLEIVIHSSINDLDYKTHTHTHSHRRQKFVRQRRRSKMFKLKWTNHRLQQVNTMKNNFTAVANVLTYICIIIIFFRLFCALLAHVHIIQSIVPGYLSFESMVFGIFFFYAVWHSVCVLFFLFGSLLTFGCCCCMLYFLANISSSLIFFVRSFRTYI